MKMKPDKTLRALGGRIREDRLRQKLTQRALASRAKISVRHLSAIERAERAASMLCLVKVARALQTTVSILCRKIED